ncbi:hypothetical protein [Microbacterium oxydans]|uniref:hypothetical protein n=1 Tax=Microbacterium oxydans TaxID=82380 RepID=UPI000F8F858B|nr:hypothetical protein [Microbacterium oxydans]AZS46648.1 hypothetical protein CVS53_01322 [Microbacterium oxydans]
MENSELWAALAGAVVGFLLSLLPRLIDRHARHREARAAAANSATEWAYRLALASDSTWSRTAEKWSDEAGLTIAKFSAAPSKGSKYPLGWFTRRITALVKDRDTLTAEERLTIAAEIRDELASWVSTDSHVHWFAGQLKS